MTALATIGTLSDYFGRFGCLLAEQVLDVIDATGGEIPPILEGPDA